MTKLLTIGATAVLVIHGLIHLLGAAAYLRLTEIDGLPYKTTLLGGAWEVGEIGIRVFGALWAVAALGILGAATAWRMEIAGWQLLLLGVTLFSLALTALDYRVAFMGVAINLAILAAVLLASRLHLAGA